MSGIESECHATTRHGDVVLVCDLPWRHLDDVHQQAGAASNGGSITWTLDGEIL